MMILDRRIKRNIKHNASFYISASTLTAIAVFAVIAIYTAISMINVNFNEIMGRGNVEDAEFTTLKPIGKAEITEIEEKYNLELEEIHYTDVNEKDYTLRIFAPTEKINIYEMLEGNDISADDEILLNRDFANANEIEPGDTLKIEDVEYKVVGLAVRPDYLYAQKEPTDFYVDDAAFGQVTMSRAAFDELEHPQTYYSIVYHSDNENEFRKYIYENYFSLNYLSADSNNRISIVRDLVGEYEIIVDMILPVMFVMIAFIVAVVLGRMVNKEQKQIGTLIALGYRRRELIMHYAIYAMIPGIIGSVLGIVISLFFLEPAFIAFATDYETINFEINIHPVSLIISVFVPTFLYMMTSVWTVGRLLNNNIVNLFGKNVLRKKKRIRRFLAERKMSFRTKFQFRSLLTNKSRTFIVILGFFISGFLCEFGFIFMDSCNYLVETGLDMTGSYEYQYFLNSVDTKVLDEGEPMLTGKFEVPGNKSLFFMNGLVENQKYLKLSTRSKNAIEYGKYYMTSNAAALYGIAAGDKFTFMQITTMKEFTITITDIVEDNTQCAVYTSIGNMAELLGLLDGSYNVIVSDKQLDIDRDKVYRENSKEIIRNQLIFAVELVYSFIYILIFLGCLVCVICTYLTVNMLVLENRHNISMLKVLGYHDREINRLVLNTNHILVPVSFGISVLACLEMCEAMFESFIAEFNLYIEPVISVTSIVICFLIMAVSYFVSLAMLKRKVFNVDMVESLKDNRE